MLVDVADHESPRKAEEDMQRMRMLHRAWAAVGAGALVVASVVTAGPAAADSAPVDPTLPATVTSDPLPTAQINGVVWKQRVVGDTVFVAGNFTKARPAGSAPGVNEVTRTHLLAYDITTGALKPFAPTVNAQVKDLAVSPDGKTLYAAGQFTTVNGVNRYRVAAFDTATGALSTTFRPTVNGSIGAITASATSVFIGGTFTSVNGTARVRIAALAASNGATLPFTATLGDGAVQALTTAPDGASVVAGGSFTSMNGSSSPGYGLARLDSATGANLPLPVNTVARNAGPDSAILSLESDGTNFYGAGYHYGDGGNIEGSFAADWATGSLVWVEDCHGDTYSAFAAAGAVYSASHKHYCGNSGGFPQTEPNWTFYRGTATTLDARGVNTKDPYGYPDHVGRPSPKILNWYPSINPGTFTGKGQGPWNVSGDSRYVLFGGEFTEVNGTPQQGLVRFAKSDKAPNLDGPRLSGENFPLSAMSFTAGSVRLAWNANYDRDNETLTYRLHRQSTASPAISEQVLTTPFWKLPRMGFTDTGLTPGSTQRYRVVVTDPFGNTAMSPWTTVTVSTGEDVSAYAQEVLGDGPATYWRLGEPSGTTVFDWAGLSDANAGTGVTRPFPGAITGDANTASRFSGTSAGVAVSSARIAGPQTFAIEAWFRTTSTSGGKIVGFGNNATRNSSDHDRHLYMDTSGRVLFGVYPGTSRTIQSRTGLNDGQWHHVVGSLGANGMQLYLDGVRVAQRTDTTSAQPYEGYWRVGGDTTWSGAQFFRGDIDEVAIYPAPLTGAQVDAHWTASGRTSALRAAPADAYGAAVHAAGPDLFWRLSEATGAVATDYGPLGNTGTYSGGMTRGATGALVGSTDKAVTFGGTNGLLVSDTVFDNPTTYSQELWFRTTTTAGGKLIGFGNAATGLSGSYDRHIYMAEDGRLRFGAFPGSEVVLTTADAYNDGVWHHVVSTQSADGMRLYVDGVERARNTEASAQAYAGRWRVGGDSSWGTQPWFAGTIDEVAVYPTALSPQAVAQHYSLGSGLAPVNQAPVPVFTAASDRLVVNVDGTGSSDPDGTVGTHAWTFGDGGSATGATASHTYAEAGTYTVTLTVTDDDGATASTSQEVTVSLPPNVPPVADLTAAVTDATVALDAAGSSDPDGTITDYLWEFGDGESGTGVSTTHTYAESGTYTVVLTVTDDAGATASTSVPVTAEVPPADAAVVRDTFGRTVAGGWGDANLGGTWASTGVASRFSVANGVGLHTAPAGATLSSTLDAAVPLSAEVRTSVSVDKVPLGYAFVTVQGRRVGTSSYAGRLRLQADGTVQVHVTRDGTAVNGGLVTGLTYAPGDKIEVRVQVEGASPTVVRAKAWKAGEPEPAAWRATMTDATVAALQAPGTGVGLWTILSGTSTNGPVAVAYDDVWVGPIE